MNFQLEIARAADLLHRGKTMESAAICGSILAREPRNASAAHLLGLALKDGDDWAQGEQWLRFSIELDPQCGEFHANLANLMRRQAKYSQAARLYRRAVELAPSHRPSRCSLALTLNDLRRYDEAESQSRILIEADPADAQAWVILGITLANQGRLPESETAYRHALALDPENQIAQNNLGALLLRMQKPEAAVAALAAASPSPAGSYELAFNRGRAFLDVNDIDAAEREFDRAVTLRPSDTEAQLNLAGVRFMRGDPKFARSLAAASAANRDDGELQLLLGQLMRQAGNLNAAEALLHDLLGRKGPNPRVQSTLAGVLHEQGSLKEAEVQALEAASAAPDDSSVIETLVNILLARGCPQDAMGFIAARRAKAPKSQAWIAYEATAARALGHDLYQHYFDYARLVRVFDLEAPAGWESISEINQALVEVLNARHRFSHHPLGQTLRNGTQTSRSLLSDPDPVIEAILKAFKAPIQQYRDSLGQDAHHPLSSRNHGDSVFTGAWSVRLQRNGFHVNHFHPDGWISSAYYVDIPSEAQDQRTKAGWLKFGEPRYFVPGLQAELQIQPRPGRLVLFPSYMWHGTNAISGPESRTSIAFDVVPGG